MRIGIDAGALCTKTPTGIAVYTKNLVSAMCKTIEKDDSISLFYSMSNIKKRHLYWKPEGIDLRHYYANVWPLKKNVDIIHGPDTRIPDWNGCKKIITIHDLFLHINQSNEMSPEKFRIKKRNELEQILKVADGIITVSNSTKNDIVNLLKFPEERIKVAHLGVDDKFHPGPEGPIETMRKKYNLAHDYLLFVGAISGRKNTERLVEAFARSKLRNEVQLVLAGHVSYNGEKTISKIKELGIEKAVVLPDYIERNDIPLIYSGASAFLFPTLYEGFGMPILEAFASKTPVLTSKTGSAPEIAGGHAILVDPYDIDSIADGINRVVEMDFKSIDNAAEHVSNFTWERCAKLTLDAYRSL